MLISFWVKNRRSFLNALRWKGILFSKSPSNSIFNCLCYHTPHSFPQSFSWFQSTLPRGERRDVVSSWKWRLYFNPRSHEGSDADWIRSRRRNSYFNPLSHEGSDLMLTYRLRGERDFNPRSHEGSDSALWEMLMSSDYFNPRSHEGSDANRLNFHTSIESFQSTLPRGERPK